MLETGSNKNSNSNLQRLVFIVFNISFTADLIKTSLSLAFSLKMSNQFSVLPANNSDHPVEVRCRRFVSGNVYSCIHIPPILTQHVVSTGLQVCLKLAVIRATLTYKGYLLIRH